MSEALKNLEARRDSICEELAALNASNPGGRPNIAGGGPGTVDHVGYKDGLYRELSEINRQIAAIEGPWEVPIEGFPV
jgi:hypothetical protein